MVKKCIKENVCEKFTDYFETNDHNKSRRNKSLLLKVPKVKLEFANRRFIFKVLSCIMELSYYCSL